MNICCDTSTFQNDWFSLPNRGPYLFADLPCYNVDRRRSPQLVYSLNLLLHTQSDFIILQLIISGKVPCCHDSLQQHAHASFYIVTPSAAPCCKPSFRIHYITDVIGHPMRYRGIIRLVWGILQYLMVGPLGPEIARDLHGYLAWLIDPCLLETSYMLDATDLFPF